MDHVSIVKCDEGWKNDRQDPEIRSVAQCLVKVDTERYHEEGFEANNPIWSHGA